MKWTCKIVFFSHEFWAPCISFIAMLQQNTAYPKITENNRFDKTLELAYIGRKQYFS